MPIICQVHLGSLVRTYQSHCDRANLTRGYEHKYHYKTDLFAVFITWQLNFANVTLWVDKSVYFWSKNLQKHYCLQIGTKLVQIGIIWSYLKSSRLIFLPFAYQVTIDPGVIWHSKTAISP